MKHLNGTPWLREGMRSSNWKQMEQRPRSRLIVPSRPWYSVVEQLRDSLPAEGNQQ